MIICVDTHKVAEPSDEQFEAAASTLKLLADPMRLRILWALLHGEHSVGELALHVGLAPSAVSQHLAKLRLADLVRLRRHGTQRLYVTDNAHLERLTTEALFHADHVVRADPARGAAHDYGYENVEHDVERPAVVAMSDRSAG